MILWARVPYRTLGALRRVDSGVGDVLDRAAMESETKHPTVEVDEWAIAAWAPMPKSLFELGKEV